MLGHVFNTGIQVTTDMLKLLTSVSASDLPFGQRKSTLGQDPGTVSSSFICD